MANSDFKYITDEIESLFEDRINKHFRSKKSVEAVAGEEDVVIEIRTLDKSDSYEFFLSQLIKADKDHNPADWARVLRQMADDLEGKAE
jgi:hypothetical protein